MNHYDFEGRAALVTGGASGIGRSVAERLRRGGARVASLDLQPPPEGTVDLALAGDVTASASVRDAVGAVVGELGSLDILVCAAGIVGAAAPTAEVSDDLWNRVLAVNATGTYNAIRAAIRPMVSQGYGRVVTVASIAAKEGLPHGDAYAASKAAVVSITRTVGRDLAGAGVLVNCVAPALIETDMARTLSAEQYANAVARIPMGRLGRPDEVATLIAFLASEDLSFSTGACFDISGGRANY